VNRAFSYFTRTPVFAATKDGADCFDYLKAS